MFGDDLSKAERVELTIGILNQALEKLHKYDYSSAQARISFARQVLEEVQLDFDLHFQAEELFEELFNRSST